MSNLLAIIVIVGGKGTDPPPVALSTLIGALVGGALSLLGTLLVERQRGKTADKAEHRRSLLEGKLAARLIAAELEDTQSVLRVALAGEPYSWPPSPGFQFPTGAWSAHGGALAAAVSDSAWTAVAVPYFSYRYANIFKNVDKGTAETMFKATTDGVAALNEWIESVGDP